MSYLHVDIDVAQASKRSGAPCGDRWFVERTAGWTALACIDGIGSGVRANLAATMAGNRMMELLRRGFSMRDAFGRLVATMNRWRDPSLPYAAFSLARILNDGLTTVLSYDAPPPLLVLEHGVEEMPQRSFVMESAVIGEAATSLVPGEGLLLMSDGITQAGLGHGLSAGWTARGVADFANQHVRAKRPRRELPLVIQHRAKSLCGPVYHDDCTVLLADCRKGIIVNILTGPPVTLAGDEAAVTDFMAREGLKVVCGGTTARVVARITGKPIKRHADNVSLIAPPRSRIDGIDLVTEGAVTLNQVYNIIEADPAYYEPDSGVSELSILLRTADRVNILAGQADNPAATGIEFRQQGILTRANILPLLVDRLRKMGKLVVFAEV